VGTAYSQHGQPLTVIDLPGTYSLAARSPDEAVTRDVLLGRRADTPQPDRILCIVDATNLERNLYLVHQVLDLGRPVILVLNMMDLATARPGSPSGRPPGAELGIPVIPCEAVNGKGLIELKLAMSRPDLPLSRHAWDVPAAIASGRRRAAGLAGRNDGKAPLIARAEALLLLTDQDSVRVAGSRPLSARTGEILQAWQKRWEAEGMDWAGTLVNSRYEAIGRLAPRWSRSAAGGRPDRERPDRRRGDPSPLGLAGPHRGDDAALPQHLHPGRVYPMDWIGVHVAALADWVKGVMPPGDLRDLITDGAIAGVGTMVTFLPQILILFFFIGLLENTGYMARAAFIMDRLMSRVGLNGKSFIPLLSSYACAIPGHHGHPHDRGSQGPPHDDPGRAADELLGPAARLPADDRRARAGRPRAARRPRSASCCSCTLLGTGGAFGFAWLFKRTLLKGAPPLMIMELPPYRLPRLKDVLLHMVERAGCS
jgi:ferrous iron transport protein B